MRRRPLFWKLFPYYFIIIVASLSLTAYFGAREMKTMHAAQITSTLEDQAWITARNIGSMLPPGNSIEIASECKEISAISGSRITVVGVGGAVWGDSHEAPDKMENHGARPEIVRALGNEVGVSTRYSSTLQALMMYVAVPVIVNGEVVAVVRTSLPVSAVEDTLTSFYRNIAIGGLAIVLLAGLISVVLFRTLTVPMRELRDGALLFAEGNFNTKLRVPDVDEIADLATTMNRMASQLDSRIQTIAEQRNEREAILSGMSEGVLALDKEEKIVSLNRVAAGLLGLDPEPARGRALYELVRIPALLEFAEQASHILDMTETEITLAGPPEKYLQVRAAALRDNQDERFGTVLVLNDITRLKKLEGLRREFVANVSHELRTPITAIMGSAETLLDGDNIDSEDSRRFLEMIARQSKRLNSLIEDLMALARLESEADQDEMLLTRSGLSEVLQAAVTACQETSQKHQVAINLVCEAELQLNMNQRQLEQAVINLLDNGIKYSIAGASVEIDARRKGDGILISVIDRGVGIPPEHLPRLFERFYRVDPARSHEVGGTGLGLSIVKHIALAHGGSVGVESQVGQGSTFSIYLPAS